MGLLILPSSFSFRTEPFDHQREVFHDTWFKEYFGIFWEQGTGKTKLTLDTASALMCAKEVDTLFVVAPNGVHRNWEAIEIHKHLPESLLKNSSAFSYHSSKAKTKRHQRAADEALNCAGPSIIAMSYDAMNTEAGKEFADSILKKRSCLYVADESARIKNHKAKRSKRVVGAAKKAPYRRILTGTPVANSPFDVFSQMRFLTPDYWKPHGLANFFTFKNYFARWTQGMDGSTGRTYPILLGYQNLDELQRIIKEDTSRVLKADVLDLPPKLYSKRFFDMSPKQSRLYKALKKDFIAELDSGEFITGDMALTRMLRLQQITCGYVGVEELTPSTEQPDIMVAKTVLRDIEEKNTRLVQLFDILEDIPHKVMIWARFRRDIDMICEKLGDKAVRYDGTTKTDARDRAIESFQEGLHGNAQYFVAHAQAAGEGLTLTAARTVIYYNNDFNLTLRLQSEDRAHRIGQNFPVNYIDIAANGSIDEYIINALLDKQDIANQVTGDKFREWL